MIFKYINTLLNETGKVGEFDQNYDVSDVHSIKKRMDINKINKPK